MWAMRNDRRIWLALLACLAFGLRVWVVLALSTEHAESVAYEHGQIAENLLAGKGFSIELLGAEGPTSQQAPFYPFLLAAFYALFGVGSAKAILAVQLLQCLAGAGLVLAVVWLAWSLVPDQPALGWIAGLGAAVYPTHLYMVTHLQVAVWAALLLTVLLAVVVSPRWRATRGGAILAGLLAGALLLVEPILVLALPVSAVAFWLAERRRLARAAWGRLGLMTAVTVVVIAPWVVRNAAVHGEFVFIKSTFGYAFWQGNTPGSWGTDKIPTTSAETLRNDHDGTLADVNRALWAARHETLYIDDVMLNDKDYRMLGQLSEPERSRLLGRRAWESVVDDPGRYLGLCLRRLGYFLVFDQTNPKAANRLYRIATTVWLVLAFVGLLVSHGRWNKLWPTYAIFALVTLFHTLVITSVRFRIPLEPMTFIWAAATARPFLWDRMWRSGVRIYRPGQCPRDPFESAHPLGGPHYPVRQPAPRRRAG